MLKVLQNIIVLLLVMIPKRPTSSKYLTESTYCSLPDIWTFLHILAAFPLPSPSISTCHLAPTICTYCRVAQYLWNLSIAENSGAGSDAYFNLHAGLADEKHILLLESDGGMLNRD